ncbi:MAG: hypothetical protein ACOYXA_10880 [Bacteroidota bacterium]
MKRLITLFLLFLFLLNVLGYYGIFVGLQWQNGRALNARLDSDDYEEFETVTYKIPLTIPYGTDSRDFERVEGTYTFKGETYRLVKQKFHRDTLHIVVIKDEKSQRLNEVLKDYVKTFTDKPEHTKDAAKLSFDFAKDYLSTTVTVSPESGGWASGVALCLTNPPFISSYFASIIHPPERI